MTVFIVGGVWPPHTSNDEDRVDDEDDEVDDEVENVEEEVSEE